LLVVAVLSSVVDTPVAAHQATPHENWVQRSDAFAAMVVKVDRGMHPESGAADPAFDDQVTDFSVSARQRARAAYRRLLDTLRAERSRERDLDVRQDLNVLVDLVDGRVHAIDVEDRYELPYLVPARVALQGINALSDPQIPPERQRHALVRLRKYSGLEPGSTPLTVVARERISAALRRPDLATPARADIEQDLAQSAASLEEVRRTFQRLSLSDYESALAQFEWQVAEFNDFILRVVVPRCQTTPRVPPALFRFRLAQSLGADLVPTDLARHARLAFHETQAEMAALTAEIVATEGLPQQDYQSLIRLIRRDQLSRDGVSEEYTVRLHDIEQVISRERLMSLPPGQPRVRAATEAENAMFGAPVTICPPSRTRPEDTVQCETVIPTAQAVGDGQAPLEDYSSRAASWTLALTNSDRVTSSSSTR